MKSSLLTKCYYYFTRLKWNVGFIPIRLEDILNGKPFKIEIINHSYKDRWFADPFILDVNDDYIYLLVEEFCYSLGRGRISKLTINKKNNEIELIEPVLQLESHLSFPAILRSNSRIQLYPENAKGHGLALYDYDPISNKCNMVKVISDKLLADAVFTDIFGDTEMYATEIPTHNGNVLNRYLTTQDERLTLVEQIPFPSNIARNAGDWFMLNGRRYRPAQDCNHCYGGAVILQEIVKNNNKTEFRDVRYIKSTSRKYTIGCHTFNHFKGVTVVDVHGYVHPFLGWFFKTFTPKCLLR